MRRLAAPLLALLLLAPAARAGDWEKVGEDDGITIYRRQLPGDPVFAYKGEGVLDAPLGKIITVARDTAHQKDWVNRLKVAKVLHELTPFDRIIYMRYGAPWPVSDRDVVFESKLTVDRAAHTAVIDVHSVTDPLAPPDACCVRAEVRDNHMEFKAVDGGKTAVLAVAHMDPRGSLPAWLVNLVQKTFPRKSLDALLKQVSRPEIADFFSQP